MKVYKQRFALLTSILITAYFAPGSTHASEPTAGRGAVIRVGAASAEAQAIRPSHGETRPLAGVLATGSANNLAPAARSERRVAGGATDRFRIRLRLSDAAAKELAANAGVVDPQEGEREYEVSGETLEGLKATGLRSVLLGGVTVYRFAPAFATDAKATGSGAVPPSILATPGSFYLSSGTVNDAIPDQGWAWRWVQVGGGAAAPPGSVTTNLQYRLRIHNDSSPSSIYCGDYQVYLSSTARGGAVPHWLVYDHLGGRTDGGFDDDAEDDADIYLNLRGTSHFNGENPNQAWFVYVKDTLAGDTGFLQYLEFQVSWNAPDPIDLQAQDVYLRTQSGDAGSRIDLPQAGQQLYPHFTFTISGGAPITGTLWRIRLDGSTLCTFSGTYSPGSYVGWCNAPWPVVSGLHNLNGTADPNGSFVESNEGNNQVNRNYSIAAPIDLQATDVYFRDQPNSGGTRIDTPQAGQSLYPHFSFEVTGASVSGTIWKIDLDGATRCTYDGTLAIGSYFGWCTAPWTVTSGTHTLRGTADPNSTISESNEGNNQASRNYTVVAGTPDIRIEPLTLNWSASSLELLPAADPTGAQVWVPKHRGLPALLAKARDEGAVRILVRLNVPFVPEGFTGSETRALSQREAIRRSQDETLAALAKSGARLVARYQFIPYLALEADASALVALRGSPSVVAIEEDIPMSPTLASSVPVISAPTAWASGFTGSGQTVAILDTGVDKTHPYFTTGGNKVVSEACYSSNSTSSTSVCPGGVTDSTASGSGVNCLLSVSGCNHGTHVAGIAAGNDGVGPNVGVARAANLIAVQVFSRFDSAASCSTLPTPCALSYTSDQMKGLERIYALRSTYSIAAVNMSLGGGRYFDRASCDAANAGLKAAIDNLRSVGIATVIAAGNNGYTDSSNAPGCISTAVSVGATTDSDAVASFSNVASFLDLLAPGVSINSSVPGGGTANFQGTSMATPHVAGAWAILKQAKPGATVAEVLSALRSTGALVNDSRSGGTVQGLPRINVNAALGPLSGGSKVFTIWNDGTSVLSVSSIQLQLAASWITWSPQAPFDVPPGGSRQVTVTVNVASAPPGQSSHRLLVASNDPNESPYPNGVFVVVDRPQSDSTPPETTLTGGPSGTISSVNASFSWTGSDNATSTAGLVYASRLDPLEPGFSAFGGATSRSYSSLRNGTYTFFVKARDQAGNQDSTPAARTFTVAHRATAGDFDGDGVSDVIVYRSGAWLYFGPTAGADVWTGNPGNCIPAPADYDGDGRIDLAQLCAGAWHFYGPSGNYLKGIWTGGVAGDLPVPADYDGDGKADVAVYRNGAWLFYNYSTGAPAGGVWTGPGPGTPIVGDFDGDGRDDFSVFQNGSWHFFNHSGGYLRGIWTGGLAGDIPVTGDYDGDRRDDVVVFRGGAWLFYNFATAAFDHGVWTGATSYLGRPLQPAPLDRDGDGVLDLAVYGGGPWHFYRSDGLYLQGIWTGGGTNDKPISRRQITSP